jgi:hypothetical protein
LLPCSECLASYNNNSVVVSGKRVKKQRSFLLKNLGAYLLFCPCWSWSIRTEGSSLWLSVFKFLLHILYWSIISNPCFHFRNSTYLVCFERDKHNTMTLSSIFHNCKEWAKTLICLKEEWRDGKGLEICTTGLEFESERVSFVKSWDNQCFTRSSGPIKYAFRDVRFPRIKKKKHFIVKKKKRTLIEIIARWDCPFSQPHFPLF